MPAGFYSELAAFIILVIVIVALVLSIFVCKQNGN